MGKYKDVFDQYVANLKKGDIKNNTGNRVLGAGEYAMTDDDCEKLANALKGNPLTTRLHLRAGEGDYGPEGRAKHRFTDKGAKKLAKALEENTSLVVFEISGADISDEAAMAFAKAIRKNNTLARLSLRNNNISAKGAIALLDACEESDTLLELSLGENPIGAEGEQRVEALMEGPKGQHILAPIDNYTKWHEIAEDNKARFDSHIMDMRNEFSRIPPGTLWDMVDNSAAMERYILLHIAPHPPQFQKVNCQAWERWEKLNTWLDGLPNVDLSKPLDIDDFKVDGGKDSPIHNPRFWQQWPEIMQNLNAQGKPLRKAELVEENGTEANALLKNIALHGKAQSLFNSHQWKGAPANDMKRVYYALPPETQKQISINRLALDLERADASKNPTGLAK